MDSEPFVTKMIFAPAPCSCVQAVRSDGAGVSWVTVEVILVRSGRSCDVREVEVGCVDWRANVSVRGKVNLRIWEIGGGGADITDSIYLGSVDYP